MVGSLREGPFTELLIKKFLIIAILTPFAREVGGRRLNFCRALSPAPHCQYSIPSGKPRLPLGIENNYNLDLDHRLTSWLTAVMFRRV
jgi:hypothetical protein